MEKISRILPASHRILKVDHSLNHPARPGASSLGRPDGVVTVRDRVTISVSAPVPEQRSVFGEARNNAPTTAEVAEDPAVFG
ncbi:MAG: hypothetical protein NZ480_04720 [Bdellovibrionaceae bacterium]|nr:hypothetical protein [Pseudobdellovibrionaceae bacterium]MDW8190784.1 hypothetical protein [Pseudobdellovibrionaceae bacterium]